MVDNNDATEENTKGLENAEKACKQTQGDADEKSKNNDDNITNDDAKESQIIEDENDDDEPAERSTYAEERFRVDRKKLEAFLQDEKDSTSSNGNFFHKIEQGTNTKISWPAKLKIGAKSRKDPYIKVAGLPEERQAAKQMILSVMDSKSSRVTLKMDVSFADHSHVIGKGGNTIKKVMRDTQCHIHFPDSNRTSSEKSNQVSISGPPLKVESARRQIRELLPIVLKFEIPAATTIPDSSSPVISSIAQMHNVTISFQPQPRTYGCVGCVKGLHSDPFAVQEAILKVFKHLTGTVPVTVSVTTQIEIDPKHHPFIRGHNGSNIKNISQATGASIHLPDPNDNSCRKSTITITGTIESAVTAKVYLLQNLPLILMFDIRDGEHDHVLEQGMLNKLMEINDVHISVKPKLKQCCKSVIVKGHEIKAPNIYKTRLHLIGEDASNIANMPYYCAPLPTLMMPPATPPLHILKNMMQGGPPPPLPVNVSTSYSCQNGGPLTPPMQSSSPLINNIANENGLPPHLNPLAFINVVPAGQRIIGSEMKMKRLSVDGLFGIIKKEKYEKDKYEGRKRSFSGIVQPSTYISTNTEVPTSGDNLSNARSADSILDDLISKSQSSTTKEMDVLVSNGTWSNDCGKKATTKTTSIDSGLNQSQDDLNNSSNLSMTTHLINKLALQRTPTFNPTEYETCKKLAENAMHGQISFSKARTPTDAWSGMGFSNSMPGSVLKERGWNNLEKMPNQQQQMSNGTTSSRLQNSPSGSLDSSVSSSGSSVSSIHSFGHGHNSPPGTKPVRPPPGLEDSHPYMDNALLLNNNFNDYGSLLSSPEPVISAYSNIKCISDLFRMLNVEQYTDAFEKEEVDLMTFVSLTDDDLKELGVSTFGARKKMLNAMRELQAVHGQPSLNNNMHIPLSLASNFASGYYTSRQSPSNDIASNSIRW